MLGSASKLYLRNLRIASQVPAKLIKLEDLSEYQIKIANVNNRNVATDGVGESVVIIREYIVSIEQLKTFTIDHNDSVEIEGKLLNVVEPIPDYIGSKIVSFRFRVR